MHVLTKLVALRILIEINSTCVSQVLYQELMPLDNHGVFGVQITVLQDFFKLA